MVVRGHVLLVDWVRMLGVVVLSVPVQRNAGVVSSVRDGGDNGSVAGPAGREAEEGGSDGDAPSGVRARNRHRRARAVGGPPVRRGLVQEEALGWDFRGIVQKVLAFGVSTAHKFWCFVMSNLGFWLYSWSCSEKKEKKSTFCLLDFGFSLVMLKQKFFMCVLLSHKAMGEGVERLLGHLGETHVRKVFDCLFMVPFFVRKKPMMSYRV
jgi:hypothetical protein